MTEPTPEDRDKWAKESRDYWAARWSAAQEIAESNGLTLEDDGEFCWFGVPVTIWREENLCCSWRESFYPTNTQHNTRPEDAAKKAVAIKRRFEKYVNNDPEKLYQIYGLLHGGRSDD